MTYTIDIAVDFGGDPPERYSRNHRLAKNRHFSQSPPALEPASF